MTEMLILLYNVLPWQKYTVRISKLLCGAIPRLIELPSLGPCQTARDSPVKVFFCRLEASFALSPVLFAGAPLYLQLASDSGSFQLCRQNRAVVLVPLVRIGWLSP